MSQSYAPDSKLRKTKLAAREALFERIGWEVSERNDQVVAKAVANRDELDSVHNLDQAGLLDAFMAFLSEIGFMRFLTAMAPSRRQRFIVPSVLILLTYMVKTLLGIEHLSTIPALLFTDPAMMKVMGFNAQWLEDGLCRRSHEKRAEGKEPPKPFSAQMVGNFIADLLVKESAAFFNAAIRCLAAFGVFPSEVTVVVDATDVETTAKCQGAGCVVRKKKTVGRNGKVSITEVLIFGFKAVVAYDLATELPVAVMVTKINRHEILAFRRLIRQAEHNLQPGQTKIRKVLVDRGFIDGPTMAWLDAKGIYFVVPAKKDMHVYRQARSEAAKEKKRVQARTRKVTHGYGKQRQVEELTTEVVGVTQLPYWTSYNDPEALRYMNRRGYTPKPINAVVVRKWDNEDYGPQGKVVFLTNQSVDKPLLVFDDYDGRSLIENTLFREGKQGWSLENLPQKNQRAAVAHIFITFAMVALTTAYREWMRQEEEEEEARWKQQFSVGQNMAQIDNQDDTYGIRRWRRELKKAVMDYVIVFQGPWYGIFHIMEFTVLAGFKVKELPPAIGTREDIFDRYRLPLPPPS